MRKQIDLGMMLLLPLTSVVDKSGVPTNTCYDVRAVHICVQRTSAENGLSLPFLLHGKEQNPFCRLLPQAKGKGVPFPILTPFKPG